VVYGAKLKVEDGAVVQLGRVLVEWDPYTFAILTEIGGTDWAFNWQHVKQILRARNVRVPIQSNEIGDFDLAAARKRLGLTQEQMAGALKVAPRTVQNWESGMGPAKCRKRRKT
jgi:DNA-binding XRE family transcriptional regulator